MPTCKFNFDRDPPVYVCGENLTGDVALTLSKQISVEDLRIDFRGHATVRWVDTMARFPKLYSADETYMEMETVVFQGGLLQPKTYNYQFNYHIPAICPTTCTTDIGRIFYELSLFLSFKDKAEVRKFTSEIMVLQLFNIEKVPNALRPAVQDDEIFYCCWPCSAGPITIHLKAACGAYVPGNTIKFTVEVANMSKRCKFRTHITASFLQIYKFTTEEPRRRKRYITYVLKDMEKHIVVKREDIAAVDEEFFVPPLPPSTQGTHIISIKYQLRAQTRIGNVAQTMSDLTLPILIGTSADITPQQTNVRNKSKRK